MLEDMMVKERQLMARAMSSVGASHQPDAPDIAALDGSGYPHQRHCLVFLCVYLLYGMVPNMRHPLHSSHPAPPIRPPCLLPPLETYGRR